MSIPNNSDAGDKKPDRALDKVEAKAETIERREANEGIKDWTEHVKRTRAEKKASGRSGITGMGADSAGKGGFASAASLISEIQKIDKQPTQEKSIAVAQAVGDAGPLNSQPQVMTDATNAVPAETRSVELGDHQYKPDEVTAQDWGALIKKGIERAGQAAQNPELREGEDPPEGGNPGFPHRGREDEFIDYAACLKANKAFPELAKHVGDGPGKIDADLIAATMRNEQFHYVNVKDTGPDHYVRAHGNWPFNRDESIGPAQIQVRNIEHLAEKFPKTLGTKADAVKSAATVEYAPYFVAAYFADVIQGIESKHKPEYITNATWKSVNDHWQKGERNEALIIAYNPDPKQINHVFTQLDNIKAPDWD